MEAPEKIYVHVKGDKVTNTWNSTWIGVHDVEYIRTDAFIEKTEKFLKSYRREALDGTGYIPRIVDDKTIEDFKKYIKGE